jgi:AcrR family transcriptional regulator
MEGDSTAFEGLDDPAWKTYYTVYSELPMTDSAPPDAPESAAAATDGCGLPSGRRCRADHKESVRRVILDAARELFVCEGYGNVSLRKIARRIGYTPMAIYVHFRDKSEILDCICEETFACLQANSERLDALALPPLERLEAGLRLFIDFGLQHPHHYQLTFMTPPACGDDSAGRRNDIGVSCYEKMRQRVARCMASPAAAAPAAAGASPAGGVAEGGDAGATGADAAAVEQASQAICTAAHGVVSLLIAWPDFPWVERERLIETAIHAAMQNVRNPLRPGAAAVDIAAIAARIAS